MPSRIKHVQYVLGKPFHVQFKMSFADIELTEVSIRCQITRSKDPRPNIYLLLPKNITKSPVLSKEKKHDLESMLKFMPLQDHEFFLGLSSFKMKVIATFFQSENH